MDKNNSGILQLLQDIKELLLGIGLILAAAALFLLSWIMWNTSSANIDTLTRLAGLVLLAFGCFHLWSGWTAHKVLEHGDGEEPKGGSHVS